jgi:predicted amidophosphoribosyltransferase
MPRRADPPLCGGCGRPFPFETLFCFDCGEGSTRAIAVVPEPLTATQGRERYANERPEDVLADRRHEVERRPDR